MVFKRQEVDLYVHHIEDGESTYTYLNVRGTVVTRDGIYLVRGTQSVSRILNGFEFRVMITSDTHLDDACEKYSSDADGVVVRERNFLI